MTTDPLERKRLLKVAEAARYLGYTPKTLRTKVFKDEVPYIKLSGGALRFRLGDLDEWIEEQDAKMKAANG